ncbi:hypothetical protein [Iodidimonas gelatinilytica]|uniref:hypothetical protein n=1 Tax=Iodidimonas gelatinilytica TaxID=1236966 RepID=UPI001B2FF912|nr:hypothetical protein [Iodidimonas gelatinilytica]
MAAALTITAEEELPIARVDTLIAIAETFERLGDMKRADATVDLAKQAAEDIGISIGTEQKMVRIVGPMTGVGRTEEAVEAAHALKDRFLKADALGTIALTQARMGNMDAAQATLDMIVEPLLALRYAVRMIENLAENGVDTNAIPVGPLTERIQGIENVLLKALGETRLAVIQAKRGETEEAIKLRDQAALALETLSLNHERARIYAGLALAAHMLGDMEMYEDYANRAANLAGGVRSDYDRALAIGDAVAALSVGGHVDRAIDLASRVTDLRAQSRLIDQLSRRSSAHAAVAPLAEHILKAVADHDERFERDRARLAVAQALARVEAIQSAAQVIADIETDDDQAQAWRFWRAS